MSLTRAVAGRASSGRSRAGWPGHAERGGVDQQGCIGQRAGAVRPWHDLNTRAERRGHGLRARRGPVGQADRAEAHRLQRQDDRPGCAAGAEHDRNSVAGGIGARLQVFGETESVGVVAFDPAAGPEDQGVHGAKPRGGIIEAVAQGAGRFLVRQCDVHAGKAGRSKPANGALEIVRRYREGRVEAIDAVTPQPVAVQARRPGMADRPACDAGHHRFARGKVRHAASTRWSRRKSSNGSREGREW